MKYWKRILACLLTLLLLLSAPVSALAEDALPPEEIPQASETAGSEEMEPTAEADLPEDNAAAEPLPEEDSEAMEAGETVFADEPLLKLGGHDTYLGGYPGALFQPEKAMTRAEVAQMLYNLLTSKPAVSQSKFSDVSLSRWYGEAVNSLAEAGVLSGYSDGTFLPGKSITRAEFVTALSRCFSLKEGDATFTDVPETHWAYQYIRDAASAGWINGVSEGIFRPNRGIKRSEAVKIMNVALGRKDDGFAADRGTQKFRDVPTTYWGYLDICEAAKPDETITPPGPNTDPGAFTVGGNAMVTASALNLRSAPSTGASVVTVLPQGTVLTVTDVSGLPSWLGVKNSSGASGYVSTGPENDPYVVVYVPGQVSGVSLSASTLSFRQYQTIRLDGTVASGKFSDMKWSSSDPSVAVVGYTIPYGSSSSGGAMVYGKKPGTTVITFSDASGAVSAKCTVTVTAAELVRFAYAGDNSAVKGQATDLIAITDSTHTSVVFRVTSGPQAGNYTTTAFTTESRKSDYGLPTNTVRIFRKSITFSESGTYTVQANAGGGENKEFTVFVRERDSDPTTPASGERRSSTECLKIIANFEGAVPEIEDDRISNGNPTVGHGLVVQKNTAFYNCMTTTEMYAQLATTVNHAGYAAAVNRFRSVNNIKMSQAQFDALVSLVYNCGSGPLGNDKGVAMAMLNAVVPPQNLSAGNPRSGTLNVSGYSVYKEASVSSQALGVLSQYVKDDRGNLTYRTVNVIGSKVIADKKEVWYQISYNGAAAWIPAGVVKLSGSDLVHDFTYADSTVVANNMLQWNKSNSKVYAGLVWRRMAEAKIFFYGNYAEAYHSHANFNKNTYGFIFPDDCKEFDYR